jgi:outer membrane protein assembly factor BamB
MKSPIRLINRKQTVSFRIVSSMLAIAPLWLMLAAASTSAQSQTSGMSSPADWTEFLRDNMQRWNPYETVVGVGNAASLRVKWMGSLNVTQGLISSPAVVNGVVYVGSVDHSVYAYNAGTGAKLWSYVTAGNVFSSPAVVNGVVYVGSAGANHTIAGNVYALNAGTGVLLWQFAATSEVEASPTVANGVVYIGADDGKVYALNAATGAALWTIDLGGIRAAIVSPPAVANGVVYICDTDEKVHAVNASTGAQLWIFTANSGIEAAPAVVNGVVYAGADDSNVYALNASTGALLWSFTTGNSVTSSPAVANGVVYIGSQDGNLYALSASTGVKLWSFSLGTSGDTRTSPAVANGVVYFSAFDGNLYALNASTGEKLWSYAAGTNSPGTPAMSSPAIVDGVVYLGAGDKSGVGGIFAFATTGTAGADLNLRVMPTATTVHESDLVTFAFPVWNMGPVSAFHEVLNTQVPAGTTFDYIRLSGTPWLGTCTTPKYLGTGQIICHENATMAPNTTWTVRLTVKVTAPSGTVITANAATLADTPDPNPTNNTATVSIKVQ